MLTPLELAVLRWARARVAYWKAVVEDSDRRAILMKFSVAENELAALAKEMEDKSE